MSPGLLEISHPILNRFDKAYITSFWGWTPITWGCVGFTQEGRRETVISETSDPFIMVVYVTQNAGDSKGDTDYRGHVAGFYEVTHQKVDRDEFIHKTHHKTEPDKWRYSLRATRAFEIIPEDRPHISDFELSIYHDNRAQAVAKHSALLSDAAFSYLKKCSFTEVPVFNSDDYQGSEIITPNISSDGSKGYVTGGNANGSGYYVPPERDSEKELYILSMLGKTDAFLGKQSGDKKIYKIGLSISPKTRANFFNRAMPDGQFSWEINRSTLKDGDNRYPDFKTTECGEMAMKKYLADNAEHLGGEFYLATDEIIVESWIVGKNAALGFSK